MHTDRIWNSHQEKNCFKYNGIKFAREWVETQLIGYLSDEL